MSRATRRPMLTTTSMMACYSSNGHIFIPPESALQHLVLTEFHSTPTSDHASIWQSQHALQQTSFGQLSTGQSASSSKGAQFVKQLNHSTMLYKAFYNYNLYLYRAKSGIRRRLILLCISMASSFAALKLPKYS